MFMLLFLLLLLIIYGISVLVTDCLLPKHQDELLRRMVGIVVVVVVGAFVIILTRWMGGIESQSELAILIAIVE